MALMLHIETATEVCSVCLSRAGEVLAFRESAPTQDHAARITLMIADCLQEAGLEMAALDAVSVSDGPGSYTSLRIGLATAKGICYALDKPLLAINTLQAIALASQLEIPGADVYVSMIDARRMEVYSQVFDANNLPLQEAEAFELHPALFDQWINQGKTLVCAGNGSEKAKTILSLPGVSFSDVRCSSRHLIPLAEMAFANGHFADMAYHAPFYLKPPNITTPRKGL